MRDSTPPAIPAVPDWLHPAARPVYRDEQILVVRKPAGVLSHPSPPARRSPKALVDGVYDVRREAYRLLGEEGFVFLVHRLDQETSGLLLLALDEETAGSLKRSLAERRVEKAYQAVLLGAPRPLCGTWRDRLVKRSGKGRARVAVRPGDPNAVTDYETVSTVRPAGVSVVTFRPRTGRTHQLRVQAAARGLPILGDPLYGDFTANRYLVREMRVKRMLLHASGLGFRHPRGGEKLAFESIAGDEWNAAVAALSELRSPLPRRGSTRPAK